MKKLSIVATGLALSATLVVAGCKGTPERAERNPEKTTSSVTETERPGTAAPSDISPITARARVSDLKVGTTLGADGQVADNLDAVPAGPALHASLAVGDVPAGSKVKAVWLGPNATRISDEVKDVAAGVAFLVFHAPDTKGWAEGDYKVEIYLGDELAAGESFNIDNKPGV